jgi:hypothetical protein
VALERRRVGACSAATMAEELRSVWCGTQEKKNGALGVGPTLDKLGARGKGSRPPGASGAAPRMAELASRLDCSNLK